MTEPRFNVVPHDTLGYAVKDRIRAVFGAPTDDGVIGHFNEETYALEYADERNGMTQPCGCLDEGDWIEPCEAHATVIRIQREIVLIAASTDDAESMLPELDSDDGPHYLVMSSDREVEELTDDYTMYREETSAATDPSPTSS